LAQPVSFRLGFSFAEATFGFKVSGMLRCGATIRKVQLSVLGALVVMVALAVPASARQASTTTTTGKSATVQKSGSSAGKRHLSTSASSSVKKSSGKTSSAKHSSRKKSSRLRGQQKIDSGRAQAIQEALIREHYLKGEATGTWNQASEDAMRRYQADHGWQSKTVPDSRALISLGLGPSNDHLLNPESAMTTVPDRPKADALPTTSHSSPVTSNPAAPSSAPPSPSATVPTNEQMGPQ